MYLGPKNAFGAKKANFFRILKLIQPKSGLAVSHPLNHRHVNLRIDSCLDVSDWDSCPQQTHLILLHGRLAGRPRVHMLGWHCACSLLGRAVPSGDSRLSWAPSITACPLPRLKESFQQGQEAVPHSFLHSSFLTFRCSKCPKRRKKEKTD